MAETNSNILNFGDRLLDVLKKTNYDGISVFSRSRLEELNASSCGDMKEFIDWFNSCITDNNCLTTEELDLYKKIRMEEKLCPEEDLDNLIQNFKSTKPQDMINNSSIKSTIENATKEHEALDSLNIFLTKIEKKEDPEKHSIQLDLESLINKELNKLQKLNEAHNAALAAFNNAWVDFRKELANKRKEQFSLDGYCEQFIFLSDQIVQNLNKQVLSKLNNESAYKKDFQPDYYSLYSKDLEDEYQTLKEMGKVIVSFTVKTKGNLLALDCLKVLENNLLNSEISFEDLKKQLSSIKDNIAKEIKHAIDESFTTEHNFITSIKLQSDRNYIAYLKNCLELLEKVEGISKLKHLYKAAFIYIVKRDNIIYNYQIDTLKQFLNSTQSTALNLENRLKFMENFTPTSKDNIDSNEKAIMLCLNIQNSSDLPKELRAFYDKVNQQYVNTMHNFFDIQDSIIKKLIEIKKFDNGLIHSATNLHENIVKKYLQPLLESIENIEKYERRIIKMKHTFEENKDGNECYWVECLNNAEDFITSLNKMHEEYLKIKEKNKGQYSWQHDGI